MLRERAQLGPLLALHRLASAGMPMSAMPHRHQLLADLFADDMRCDLIEPHAYGAQLGEKIVAAQYTTPFLRLVFCGTGCGAGGISIFRPRAGRDVPRSARDGGVDGLVCGLGGFLCDFMPRSPQAVSPPK